MPDQLTQDPRPAPEPEIIADVAKCVPPSVPIDTLLGETTKRSLLVRRRVPSANSAGSFRARFMQLSSSIKKLMIDVFSASQSLSLVISLIEPAFLVFVSLIFEGFKTYVLTIRGLPFMTSALRGEGGWLKSRRHY